MLNQNVSGMNRFLFGQLGKRLDVLVRDVPADEPNRFLRKLKSFRPGLEAWLREYDRALRRHAVSAGCWNRRSDAARGIAQCAPEAAALLQIGCTFDGISGAPQPKALFASWNAQRSYLEWPDWAPFADEKAFRAYYDRERECYHSADRILCTNRYVMRSFVAEYGVPAEKLRYIGYGANFDELPEVTKDYSRRVGLFVGYEFERKGGPAVVEAFQRIRRDVSGAVLRIIGPGRLPSRFAGEGIEHLPRIQDRRLLQQHFSEATFFVMPSVCEPFGLVFLEAMAHGNACIGSTNDAMPEIIEDGKTGYTVPSGDIDELALRMRALFGNGDLSRELGQAAYRRVKEEFNWDRCGERAGNAFFESGMLAPAGGARE